MPQVIQNTHTNQKAILLESFELAKICSGIKNHYQTNS